MYMHEVYVQTTGQHQTLFLMTYPSYFLRQYFLLGLEIQQFGWTGWPVSLRDLPGSASPVLRLQAHATTPGDCRRSNSGPHICIPS